jgi:hypothetical protein
MTVKVVTVDVEVTGVVSDGFVHIFSSDNRSVDRRSVCLGRYFPLVPTGF